MKTILPIALIAILLPLFSRAQSRDSLISASIEPLFLQAFQNQDPAQALHWGLIALDSILKVNPESLEPAAKWRSKIGAAYLQLQNFDASIPYFNAALQYYSQQKGDKNLLATGKIYQNLGYAYSGKRDFAAGKEALYKAIAILKNIDGNAARNALLMAYGTLTAALANNNEYEATEREVIEGIRLAKLYFGDEAPQIGVLHQNWGLSFYNQGLHREAIREFEAAFRQYNLNEANKNGNINERFNILNNLGGICVEMGDYEKALVYCDRAIGFLKTYNVPDGSIPYLNAYSNIAQAYLKLEDTTQALAYFQKTVRLLDETPDALAGVFATAYDGYGQTLLALKKPNAALEMHQTGLQKVRERFGTHWYTAGMLYDIGVDYRALGQRDSATKYLKAAIDTYQKAGGGQPTLLSEMYRARAEMAVEQSLWSAGLVLLDSAFAALTDTAAILSDTTRALQVNLESRYQQAVFLTEADLFLKKYLHGGRDFADLESAHRNLQSASIWLERYRASLSAYNPVILQNIQDYTRVAEAVLWEMYRQKHASKIADEMFETADRGKSLELFEKFRFVLDRAKLPLDSLMQNRISRSGAQRLLAPDQCLLEYTLTDSVVYIFLLRPDGMLPPIAMPKDPQMEIWLADLLTIAAPDTPLTLQNEQASEAQIIEMATRFAKSAHGLYQLLVAPLRPQLARRVIVVPDGKLNNLPFEVLLDTPVAPGQNFAKLPYLIRDFEFGYCNSAVLYREMKARKSRAKLAPLAIAPFDTWGDSNWSPLYGSGAALGQLSKLMQCDTFLGISCTKDLLTTKAGGRRLLYLFTHAEGNKGAGARPFLLLRKPGSGQPDSMFIGEIASLHLDAELVALSACETALGELRRGEGNRGIAWAFTAAGAKSLVTTLWKADVGSAAFIFGKFYIHLADPKAPMTRDAALRQAKLDYLDEQEQHGDELYGSQPYFWAPFILSGENGRMRF